jgi:predicted nuclease with TOPRIM domain
MTNWPQIQAKRGEREARTEVMELTNKLDAERDKNEKLRKRIKELEDECKLSQHWFNKCKELEAQLKFKPNAYDNDGNPIQYGVSGGERKCQRSKSS